jgi:hypothetical protein
MDDELSEANWTDRPDNISVEGNCSAEQMLIG